MPGVLRRGTKIDPVEALVRQLHADVGGTLTRSETNGDGHCWRKIANESRFPLARRRASWHLWCMNHVSPDKPVRESMAAGLARSEAQIAAGQTVPLEPVIDCLRASIARMQRVEAEKHETLTPKG